MRFKPRRADTVAPPRYDSPCDRKAMNGKPLDEESGPFRLVITEGKRPASCVRNLVSIQLKSAQ